MGDPSWRHYVPNIITIGRAVVAIPYVVLLSISHSRLAIGIAAAIFIVSMVFDVIDGYLARKWNAETTLGRILDPALDKVVICGSLVLCIDVSHGMLYPWMVVVVLARELGVTALRSYLESRNVSFQAKVAGKLKTALECVAIGAILVNGATGDEVPVIHGFTLASIWLMLVIVLYSGVSYTTRAVKLLNEIVAEERES
jgi:CDP-diacylglycerol--glycerol-3-phosphate 3-phosphatidyltransferase